VADAFFRLVDNFHIENIVHIVGDYENSFIAVCQKNAEMHLIYQLTAFVVDLDGGNRRKLLLPYDQLKDSRGPNNSKFKYLKFTVCGDHILFELTYISEPKLSANRNLGRPRSILISVLKLYKIKDAFALKLEFVKSLPGVRYTLVHESGEQRTTIPLDNVNCDAEGNIYKFTFRPFKITVLERRGSYMYNTTKRFVFINYKSKGETFNLLGSDIITTEMSDCATCNNVLDRKRPRTTLNVYMIGRTPCTDEARNLNDESARLRLVIKFTPAFYEKHAIFADDENRLIAWPRCTKSASRHLGNLTAYIYTRSL
jgi:hypothetical protein